MIMLLTLAASLFAPRVSPPPARLAVPAQIPASVAAPATAPAPAADAEKVEAEDEEGCG